MSIDARCPLTWKERRSGKSKGKGDEKVREFVKNCQGEMELLWKCI